MVVKKPGLMSSTWTSFTSELEISSWMATLAMILVSPLFLAFISQYSPYEDWKVSYTDAYVLTLGALSFQGIVYNFN